MKSFARAIRSGRPVRQATRDLVARFSTPPSALRLYQIDRLLGQIIDCGAWAQMACLYVTAAADSQAALLNWKSTSYNLTNNGAAFTADRGYLGDGSSDYLETGFDAQTGTNAGTASDNSCGAWINIDGADAGNVIGCAFGSHNLQPNDWGALEVNIGNVETVAGGGLGFSAGSRTATGVGTLQRNATQTAKTPGTPAWTSGAQTTTLLSLYSGGGWTASRVAAAFMGKGLTDVQLMEVYVALAEYLTEIGGA